MEGRPPALALLMKGDDAKEGDEPMGADDGEDMPDAGKGKAAAATALCSALGVKGADEEKVARALSAFMDSHHDMREESGDGEGGDKGDKSYGGKEDDGGHEMEKH
jgi:hypothetical protein